MADPIMYDLGSQHRVGNILIECVINKDFRSCGDCFYFDRKDCPQCWGGFRPKGDHVKFVKKGGV